MKMPSKDDAIRCLEIRERSKLGRTICSEDLEFISKMYRSYHKWYSATEAKVFNATVPFGSDVSMEDPLPDVYWEEKS